MGLQYNISEKKLCMLTNNESQRINEILNCISKARHSAAPFRRRKCIQSRTKDL